jgi:Na+-translocating ferredoxin:NAD+ oxidoreductase RnfE subunit
MSEVDAALKQGLHRNDGHYVLLLNFCRSSTRSSKLAQNGMSLAGIRLVGQTRSGTLIARPRQSVLFSKRRDYTIGIGDKNLRFFPASNCLQKLK